MVEETLFWPPNDRRRNEQEEDCHLASIIDTFLFGWLFIPKMWTSHNIRKTNSNPRAISLTISEQESHTHKWELQSVKQRTSVDLKGEASKLSLQKHRHSPIENKQCWRLQEYCELYFFTYLKRVQIQHLRWRKCWNTSDLQPWRVYTAGLESWRFDIHQNQFPSQPGKTWNQQLRLQLARWCHRHKALVW